MNIVLIVLSTELCSGSLPHFNVYLAFLHYTRSIVTYSYTSVPLIIY